MAFSFKPVQNDRVERYPTAASQTIAKGDPVVINANGLIEVATAASAALLGVAATPVTASSAGDEILVYNDPKAVFVAKCDNAAENLQATVGDEVDLIGSTGAFFVNLGASTTDVFVVRQIGSYFDPLLDGTFDTFDDGTTCVVEINIHQLSA